MDVNACDLLWFMMSRFFFLFVALVVFVTVSGCTALNQVNLALGGGVLEPVVATPSSETDSELPVRASKTAEDLDNSTPQERDAAIDTAVAGRSLGQTVVSLGSPAEPGFWLKTPLVSAATPGQVRNPSSGNTISVTLIPIDGPKTAGSRMSLSAMRLLDVNLAELVTVEVFR